jgi:adenosylcobinamide-GDP ribazoletransferase
MLEGLKSALNTLTIIPTRGGELSMAIPWFPFVGAVMGAAMAGCWALIFLAASPPWPEGGAFFLVLLNAVFTRGLHLDGLSDWADSTGALFDRAKRLSIMKDVHLGAFGASALVLDIIARWICFLELSQRGVFLLIIPVMTVSRTVLVELMSGLPYARSSGGMAAPFVAGASRGRRLTCLASSLLLVIPFGSAGFVLLALGLLMSIPLKGYFSRRYGGITGDLLGASNEMVEISLMFFLAFFSDFIRPYLCWPDL